MSTVRKATIAAALVLVAGSMPSVARADAEPKYALQRIPMGPRPDQYVMVRVFDSSQRERPYALTGSDASTRTREPIVRHIPSHPKGTHGEY
jgi:hypothetical protein